MASIVGRFIRARMMFLKLNMQKGMETESEQHEIMSRDIVAAVEAKLAMLTSVRVVDASYLIEAIPE